MEQGGLKLINVQNIEKKFKNKVAINKISFKINKGEVVGLLGENGAGKTTILRMLSTMLKPTSGTALVNGYDIINEPDKVRSSIGILFGGEAGLYDRLTARENIKYFANLNGIDDTKANVRINELAELLSMKNFIDERAGKFSRGMKQKVAIARSIVHDPPIILLDEPSIGLDISTTIVVQDFILKCKEQNKAILFSSHSMNEIEKVCDRIIMIHKGKLIEDSSIKQLKIKNNNEDLERIFINLVGDK